MPAIPIIDPETVDSIRALQTPGDAGFVRSYFTALVDSLPGLLERIALAISSRQADALCKSSHALKSTCVNIGATPIVELCVKLDLIGKSGKVDGASELIQALTGLVRGMEQEILALPEMKGRK